MQTIDGGIAFFDSGIGGLTVLAECRKYISDEAFYYYGDNLHAPYGNLPPRKIREYVFAAFERFRALNVKAAVVACNTATSLCVESLREKYTFPIVGAEPAVFTAAKAGGEIFVLTTRATYESGRFHILCENAEQKFRGAKLRLFPCDALAGEIEKPLFDKEYTYAHYLPKGDPASVVLGCTHYVYLKERIAAYYNCRVYDGNEGMARRLATLIGKTDRDTRPPLTPTPKNPPISFLGDAAKTNKHVFEQMFGK